MTAEPRTLEEWAHHCGRDDAANWLRGIGDASPSQVSTATEHEIAERAGVKSYGDLPKAQKETICKHWHDGFNQEINFWSKTK